MPTKKPSMFDVSGKEPPKPKLPTVKQFIKEKSDADYPIYSTVTIIWFPGNWDNYNIETEVFRCSIGSNHPLYEAMDKNIVKHCEDNPVAIVVELQDREGTICLRESNRYGTWKRLGNAGYRFESADESESI